MGEERYETTMAPDHVAQLRRWHDAAMADLRARGACEVEYLGLDLEVPAEVFGPTPTSDLLGRAVLETVRPGDRVLDMGTGTGANAILAATAGGAVVGVDINPLAVGAAEHNAARNGVGDRTEFVVGDLFDPVDGVFDVVVFDPPFRWFRPSDLLEAAVADEGYATLGRFVRELPDRLAPGGRALVFFGTSGDLEHLLGLIGAAQLRYSTVATRVLARAEVTVTYSTFLLERSEQ